MKYRLVIVLLHVLAHCPPGLTRGLAAGLARWCQWTGSRMYRVSQINLALCLPGLSAAERDALARDSVRHTLMTILESGAVWLWPAERALGLIVATEGEALLREAHARGRGVLVLAPHLGNWELVGLYLNQCGLGQSYQLYQAPADPALAALILRARSRAGASMVATDRRGVAALLKGLRAGGIAGILPDQVPPDSGGDFAPFFGVPALTMTLLNRLQQQTGAPVVTIVARREARGFTLVFRAPDPQIYASDMPTALAGLNRSIEAVVRESPAQYQWEYKRFKRQPPGRERPY